MIKKKRIRLADIDKDLLNKYLNDDLLSAIKIGTIFGCSRDFIDGAIKHYGLTRPPLSDMFKSQFRKGRVANCKILDVPTKEDIEYLYIERQMSLLLVSAMFDTSIPTLKKWLKQYNILQRSMSEQQIIQTDPKRTSVSQIGMDAHECLHNEEWMKDACSVATTTDISRLLNVGCSTTSKSMKLFGIEPDYQIVDDKRKKTCNKKYGFDSVLSSPHVIRKCRETSLTKYGVPIASQRHYTPDIIAKLDDKEWLIEEYKKGPAERIAMNLGIVKSTVLNYLIKHGIERGGWTKNSFCEKEVFDYIQSIYSGKIIQSDRSLIWPLEIDIYLPEKKLAIEFNGIYWHSEQQGKGRNYHLDKTLYCEMQSTQLIHIFENEWMNECKQEIWKSVLANKLGISNHVIGARQTRVIRIQKEELRRFLENNHLQGACASAIHFALEYGSRIVAVMSFGQARYTNSSQWELLRYATLKGFRVMGGASKLLAHFRRLYSGSIVSYANRRWSNGNLYHQMGFTHSHDTDPNYFYWNVPSKLESRLQYQKHKLAEKIDIFDPDLSEYDNMLKNGYDRIFDCGNMVFRLE